MSETAEAKYRRAVQLAENVANQMERVLSTALRRLGNPDLVRAALGKPRTKELASLARKAVDRKWTIEEAIEKCGDFIGFRIVCNNLQDAARVADLVENGLKAEKLECSRQDYVANPRESGYRAIHLTSHIRVGFGVHQMTLGCEIQIRTLLQDAWGQLSRIDLYGVHAPEALLLSMARLGQDLAQADLAAEKIRQRVTRPRRGTEPSPGAPLTAPALAFIYKRAFGEDPPDYLVERALRRVGESNVRADALDSILQNKQFVGQACSVYAKQTRWDAYPERIFDWGLESLLHGKRSALALARKDGEQDWDEIDRQYKSELAHSIPETWSDLREELEDRTASLEDLIRFFEIAASCMCGTELVDYDSVAESIIHHYRVPDGLAENVSEVIAGALSSAGYEDSDGSQLCSHCCYVMNKD